ncbi:MAG: hypothetical protein SFV24_21405 [Gemmatimonadales bacterium]|nr:hypothetical protein [Gemmatimonadales bacterium]
MATLGARDSLRLDLARFSFSVNRSRRIVTTGLGARERAVSIFSWNGELRQTIAGPSDSVMFSAPRFVFVGDEDTIIVIDRNRQSVDVLGANGVGRTLRLPFGPTAAAAASGRVVVAGQSLTRSSVNQPLYAVSLMTGRVEGFGPPDSTFRADRPALSQRLLAVALGNRVWTSRANQYRLDLHEPTGRVRLSLTRIADWFEPWDENHLPVDSPAKPVVAAIQADRLGLIWVFVMRSRQPFRPLRRPESDSAEALPSLEAVLQQFDTVVEVIDPSRSAVLASTLLSGYWVASATPGYVARFGAANAGSERVEIMRIRLVGSSAGRSITKPQ